MARNMAPFVPTIDMLRFPKTMPNGLRENLAQYEPVRPSVNGPMAVTVGNYTSPVAPVSDMPVRVLFEGANKVSF